MIRCLLVCCGLGLLAPAQPPSEKADIAKFQGEWRCIGGNIGGKKIDAGEAEKLGLTLTIKGDRIQAWTNGKPQATYSFKVITYKSPREIDTVELDGPDKGLKARGIYSFEDEDSLLKVCLRDKVNGRPSKFDVADGVDDRYYMFQRKLALKFRTSLATRMLGYAISPVIRAALVEIKK